MTRFSVDELPVHCAIEVDIFHAAAAGEQVRFTAIRYAEDNVTVLATSRPSGWFTATPDEPVVLTWDAFEFDR